jgi:hypothetical protein
MLIKLDWRSYLVLMENINGNSRSGGGMIAKVSCLQILVQVITQHLRLGVSRVTQEEA